MWTYRNEPASINSVAQESRVTFNKNSSVHTSAKVPFSEKTFQSAAHSPVTTIGKASFAQRVVRSKKQFGIFTLGGALLYLTGMLLGALWQPGTDSWLWKYAQHYVDLQIDRHMEHQLAQIFCAQFLALLTQLILAALAGFCVFGVALLPALILLKGIGTGFFTACLYLEYGLAQGAGIEFLLFFFPQLLGLFLLLSQSAAAWRLSRELLAVCIHNRGTRPLTESKRVLSRLLLCCCTALLPAILSCVCSFLFAGLFLA